MYLSTDQLFPSCPPSPKPFHAVETLHEQGSGEQNEDVLLRGEDIFGVFDGATSLEKFYDTGGSTGGLCAARIAANTFRDGSGSLPQIAGKANRLLREAQLRCRIPLHARQRLWSTSLAVVRLGGTALEYCHTGDSMILLLHDDGGHTLLSPELDVDSETLTLWQNAPLSEQPIHTCLADQIVKVRLEMNVRYGVLNGEPESMHFLRHGRQSLHGITDILLFTDGLALPKADPGQPSDWQSFVDLYRAGGLAAIRDHVRSFQRHDPACRRYPRFKMHDDIAAIAVTIDHGSVAPGHTSRRFSQTPSSSSIFR